MLKTIASKISRELEKKALLMFGLAVFFYFPGSLPGQVKLNFKDPFRKCREYSEKNGQLTVIASDNEKNIILLQGTSTLISISSVDLSENWRTEISGLLESNVVSDTTSAFFITGTGSSTQSAEKLYILTSVSLKTGLTKWQRRTRLDGNLHSELNEPAIFIQSPAGVLSAVDKESGATKWEKSYGIETYFVEISKINGISAVLNKKIVEASTADGNVLKELPISENLPTAFLIDKNRILLGSSNGEVRSIFSNDGTTDWKFKTGGSISAIIKFEEGLLVTSFDNFAYFFSANKGKLKWKKRIPDRINMSPLIVENHVVLGSLGGKSLLILDLVDGKLINQIELPIESFLSGPPLIIDERLYLQTTRGISVFSNSGC